MLEASFDIIISTVGKQPTPVLLPLLEYAPAQAYLIPTKDVESVARGVRTAMQHNTPDVRVTTTELVQPYIAADTVARCEPIIQQARRRGWRIALNITGGTTVMAMGAQQVARAYDVPMIYVNTDDGQIIHLAPDGREVARATIASQVSVKLYALAHDATVSLERVWGDAHLKNDHFLESARAIGALGTRSSRLMDLIRASFNKNRFTLPDSTTEEQQLLDTLVRYALLNADKDGYAIGSTHESTRGFLEGHWLEVYVADACHQSGLFDDVRCSVTIERRDPEFRDRGIMNELDVVVTSRGRLGAISCKTGKEISETKANKKDARKLAVSELDTLLQADLMGLYARKVLVTNQPQFEDELFKRAHFSQTCRITGGRLRDVAKIVADHLQTPQLNI